MIMVKYIEEGDIFKVSGVSSYAHGCNCAGAMGKGIAVQFKEKYPEMYKMYNKLCKSGEYAPGDVFAYNHGNGYVYNLGTQETWRTKAKLEYIKSSLEKMLSLATEAGVSSIAMPAIGAGLGGLKWADVKEEIERASRLYPEIDLYVVEKYKPT